LPEIICCSALAARFFDGPTASLYGLAVQDGIGSV
jgi:hypothetical protein